MNRILNVTNLEKYYGEGTIITKAVDGISFYVENEEFLGIMGSSGSGKTTLLNCISTIDTPTAGKVMIDGIDIQKISATDLASFRREKLGFVFQDYNLIDALTLEENIGLALVINGSEKKSVREKTQKIAQLLGIKDILKKYPYEVSGGQKQRCACARAIIHDPCLILADEPTGALDSHSSGKLLQTLEEMNQKKGATILMVTHDARSASYCKRVLFLKDGRIFNEIYRGKRNKAEFQSEIMNYLAVIGGDNDAN
ncbi:ABC transporter, ATP-binding protein [Lachnospiraceae bacterium KM106-2]|nr:ABC transporter, ATP-binding protein [Lachnospiraceae bacterium KM106-2]